MASDDGLDRKGKGRATENSKDHSGEASKGTGSQGINSATANSNTASVPSTSAPSAPVVAGARGDWTAVWSADRNKYYFWNKVTNVTTWKNPFADADKDGVAQDGKSDSTTTTSNVQQITHSTTSSTAGQPAAIPAERRPTAEDFGGIDPDLAYLDPTLGRKGGANSAGAYTARFNARTGKFQGDPTMNPDRVSEVERGKRQNQFYFDYTNWEKSRAMQQEENARKRAAGELVPEDDAKRKRPSKAEMVAIRERNKEKKDKRQKGWLLE